MIRVLVVGLVVFMLFGLVVKIVSGEDRDFRKSRRSRENFQLGECQLFSEDHFSALSTVVAFRYVHTHPQWPGKYQRILQVQEM